MYDSKIGCRSSMPKLKFRKKSIHQMEKIPSITPGVMQVMDLQEVADPTALLEKKKYLKQRDEFLLNKGRLIDNIQFEIPRITDKAPSLDLIREDVRLQLEFEKIGLEFEVSGKQSYKTWFERLRWTSRLALGWVEVSQCKIRPDIDPMSRYVRCRWSVTAYPRLFMQSAPIRIDLLSIFELDGRGYVKKHEITDVEESSVQIPAVLRSLFVASPAMMDPVPMQSVTNESPISGQY
eukprot:CAMPEP_0184478182 /NCGR_PEP_ID=MMETSP0113_2-20130426/273_1 /TAXON_ID=91329 /ORGANISM="Norrisiella sphaerica, Strain BC52" /LENGTH=235 /DNA_ID=CAMNT_0026855875 /DNA_START=200 /DNA_END=907 /DNA_ORIENTATION=-